MAVETSQGFDFAGIGGLTSAKIKWSRPDPFGQQLENSTLALAVGATRTYENGLTDGGPATFGGITIVASLAGFGASGPAIGDEVTYDGAPMRCTEADSEDAVGELKKWTATFSTYTPTT